MGIHSGGLLDGAPPILIEENLILSLAFLVR